MLPSQARHAAENPTRNGLHMKSPTYYEYASKTSWLHNIRHTTPTCSRANIPRSCNPAGRTCSQASLRKGHLQTTGRHMVKRHVQPREGCGSEQKKTSQCLCRHAKNTCSKTGLRKPYMKPTGICVGRIRAPRKAHMMLRAESKLAVIV